MVGWHHWLNGNEFEQTLGGSEGRGSLVCCSPWGCKELDTTEWLNSNVMLGTMAVLLWFLPPMAVPSGDECIVHVCLSRWAGALFHTFPSPESLSKDLIPPGSVLCSKYGHKGLSLPWADVLKHRWRVCLRLYQAPSLSPESSPIWTGAHLGAVLLLSSAKRQELPIEERGSLSCSCPRPLSRTEGSD